jgi:nucleolar protein 56
VYQDKSSEAVYIVDTILGLFALDEEGELIDHALYPSGLQQRAEALDRHMRGEATEWLADLLSKLSERGYRHLIASNRGLAEASHNLGFEVEVAPSEAERRLRERLGEIGMELRVLQDPSELHILSHRVSQHFTRRLVSAALAEREVHIFQAVHLLANLDKALNALSSNLREWYGVHFPELGRLVADHETYARLVAVFGERVNFTVEKCRDLGLSEERAGELVSSAEASLGAPLQSVDLEALRELARLVLKLYEYRRRIEEYLGDLMEEVAPNLSRVIGPLLAAKLIDKAGGLRRLAMMPSSKIQLLGAEKAMFRALKRGVKMPKHGLIFQHPYIHRCPKALRGRAARLLASKLAIAARADAITGARMGDRLRDELEREVRALRKNRRSPTSS